MPSRNPRISNASAQHLRMELDVVAEVETRVQHQRWWSLRFEHPVMEKRFQIYHEESSMVSRKWACGVTLGSAAALQAAVFYDVFALKSQERTPWVFVEVAVAGNALLLVLWGVFLWTSRRVKRLGPYFQVMLFALGLSMLMLIIVLGLPLAAYETEVATTDDQQDLKVLSALDEARKAHDVTRTMFFLLILLGAIATTWYAQFLAYCALAICTLLTLGGWMIGCSDYLRRQWHLVVLFFCSLFLLGSKIYCGERILRHKFLRARHLMLENLKLFRQNSVMHQQLRCHVDAVGIGHGLRGDEPRAASNNAKSRVLPQQHGLATQPKNCQTASEPPATGESRMENVLRSLVQLRQRLEGDEQATDELDFVLQTLTSEHDLFLDPWSRQRRVPTSGSTGEKAGTGWLSLLEEKRNQRRKMNSKQQQQIPSPMAFLAKTLRRTSSVSRLTALTLLENFLPPRGDIESSEHRFWPPDELLTLSATSQELDLFAFAHSCTLPLTTLLLATLESHRVFDTLPLRIESVADFVQEIEARYQPKNPYHNALHAASVVWDVNFFLRKLEARRLTPNQLFSALIAAAVHDVNHPGVNNAFLVATTAPLAIKYSDDSVLERMHLAEAFQTCTKDGCDIFEAFPPDLRRQSRLQIISMVLATDLSRHLKHVNRLKSKLYAVHPTPSDVSLNGGESSCSASALGFSLPDELILQTVMMMADVGHAMKSFPLHLSWSERVAEEFYRQGDTERQFGLTISPLCDRGAGVDRFEKNQIGFLEFVVLPLYNAARDVLPLVGFDDVILNVRQNAATWEKRALAKSPAAALAIPDFVKEGDLSQEVDGYTEVVLEVGNDSKTRHVSYGK
ncbi:cAMP-specific 3',5'-cyclic phosphodiesterase 4D [Phytophthora pseudosyringae]|uniref:Phosphodiesterase n=1 Tax=Phytophthora pseudosyringae TaxID=221518 RepID=A0A8T1W5H7_9STRA|nr:cAMP-specific 3',5'-cyclic phosphodiesterase 4D [Phytophthora pseudosyringae]